MYEYKCLVRRVVDGDTVDVDIDLGFKVWLYDQRIRLLGIDTPELRTRDLQEKVLGLLAKKRIVELLPVGEVATIRTSKDGRGKFGRILGDFLIEASVETVCQLMIRERLAVAYHGQAKADIELEHLENRKFLIERDPALLWSG